MEDKICKELTSQRVKKAIAGYSYENTTVEGLGGGFQYCVLSKPLFDKDGKIDKTCTFDDSASYIYFTETKTVLNKKEIRKNFIGMNNDVEYYLIFNGIGQNTLNKTFLNKFDKDTLKIIYADNCTVADDTLEHYNTIFKQIPYEVRLF